MTTNVIFNAKEPLIKFSCDTCESIFETNEYDDINWYKLIRCPVCNSRYTRESNKEPHIITGSYDEE